jgi:hypothetical protein
MNLSLLCNITRRIPTVVVKEIIESSENLIFINEYNGLNNKPKVFLNGILMGLTENAQCFIDELKNWRDNELLHHSISFTFDNIDNEIKIFCDEGRLIRPLFTLNENGELNVTLNDKPVWKDLVEKKFIQYLDSSEIENYVVAMNEEILYKYKNDFCEIYPATLLGVMGCSIPFPDHNQSPRNIYQASMGKQAIGIHALSHQIRTDTISHVLYYPQKPLVNTKLANIMGFGDMPSGMNAIVAIATFTSFNQEDSIVANKSSIERGLFNLTSYRTIMDCEQKQGTYNSETICLPPIDKRKRNYNYGFLNENGIVQTRLNGKSIYVDKGDVIIGKILTKSNKNSEEEIIDVSYAIKAGEEGYVDRIIETITPNGYKMIKVIIRNQKIPEIGDKLASRSAQKGTIGAVLPHEDMPFTSDGIVPDLLINSLCIPSRMTISQLLETVLGKAGCMNGTLNDATPFTENSTNVAEKVCDLLHQNGFQRHGWETMYSGFTGEPLEAQIFIGPTFYQRLKHMVSDKIHCLDFQTEVLTLDGWKTIHHLSKNDFIATLKDNKLVYEKPIDIMKYQDYEGSMYYIQNSSIDFAVTGNHRMWVSKKCERKWSPYTFERADEIVGKFVRYKKNAIWEKQDYQFVLPSVTPSSTKLLETKKINMHEWLIFLGIWYAEGCLLETDAFIIISVHKKRVKKQLFKILNLFNDFTYDEIQEKVHINDYQIYTYLKSLNVEQKKLPSWVFELSSEQSKSLLNGILLSECYHTSSIELANQLQQLCLHAGWSATISDHDLIKISVIKEKLYPSVNQFKIQNEEYFENKKCPVFCLQVPSEVFYVRRNGKCAWTGNSRSQGHVTNLTRQPLEGRARFGGLRFGEMERDCMIAHGTSRFIKERLFEKSDPYQINICDNCGNIATTSTECKFCNNDNISKCNLPYATKLLLLQLNAMGIKTLMKIKQ